MKKKDEEMFRMTMQQNKSYLNNDNNNNNNQNPENEMTVDFHATYNIMGGLSSEDVEASKKRQLEIEAELEKEAKEKAERWAKARAQQRRKQKKTVGMLDDPEG